MKHIKRKFNKEYFSESNLDLQKDISTPQDKEFGIENFAMDYDKKESVALSFALIPIMVFVIFNS